MTSGTERSVDKIASIYNDQGGNAKIRNQDLQSKTAAIQDEFEKLMSEMVKNRQGLGGTTNTSNQYVGNTADLLDNYYVPGPERKHKSPTRRLINHKNSTTQHKQRI